MISDDTLKLVEQTAKELFEKLETEAQIKAAALEDGGISLEITLQESQAFIGEGGQTLLELQHVMRLLARKKAKESLVIALDINEYRKSKETYLRQLANSTADDVVLLGKERSLPPMSAQDRRVVHMVIANRKDVVSESVGQDPERRVVIKPAP